MNIGMKEEGNLICLFFFTRAYETKAKNSEGNVYTTYRREWVRCRLWFKGVDDLKSFLAIHQPIQWGPELFATEEEFTTYNCEKETIETIWPAYYTMTTKQLGFK